MLPRLLCVSPGLPPLSVDFPQDAEAHQSNSGQHQGQRLPQKPSAINQTAGSDEDYPSRTISPGTCVSWSSQFSLGSRAARPIRIGPVDRSIRSQSHGRKRSMTSRPCRYRARLGLQLRGPLVKLGLGHNPRVKAHVARERHEQLRPSGVFPFCGAIQRPRRLRLDMGRVHRVHPQVGSARWRETSSPSSLATVRPASDTSEAWGYSRSPVGFPSPS